MVLDGTRMPTVTVTTKKMKTEGNRPIVKKTGTTKKNPNPISIFLDVAAYFLLHTWYTSTHHK